MRNGNALRSLDPDQRAKMSRTRRIHDGCRLPQWLSGFVRQNVSSHSVNINTSYYDVSRTFVRVTGVVRPDGSWALDGRYSETKNLTGYFAKSHGMRPKKLCPE